MKMFNKSRSFLISSRSALVGSLVAALLLVAVVLIPAIGQSIIAGFLFVPFATFLLSAAPYVLQGVVAVMFGGVVAALFYLLRIKNSLFVSGVGLSLGYVLFSWLNKAVDIPVHLKATALLLMALIIFWVLMWIGKRLTLKTFVSAAIFVGLLGSCVYIAQVIQEPIERKKAEVAHRAYLDGKNQEFEATKQALNFTVYYPTYNSAELPASELKLNGYSQERRAYTNPPHVTFKLGKAMVTQAALVKNQEKLMDFTRNCDFTRVSHVMDSRTEVSQREIEDSLENLSRCNVIHETPAGTKVFYREGGQWTTFYLQSGTTNIVIQFDDVNVGKYDDALLPEVKKIIDSLQPVSVDKLQRGKEGLADRS